MCVCVCVCVHAYVYACVCVFVLCRIGHVSIRVARNQSPSNIRVDSEVRSSNCSLVSQTIFFQIVHFLHVHAHDHKKYCVGSQHYSDCPATSCTQVYINIAQVNSVICLCARKLVRRLTTPDLMFGQMIAPPPSSSATKTCVSAEDVLKCFHETGSPATSELSPIAVSANCTLQLPYSILYMCTEMVASFPGSSLCVYNNCKLSVSIADGKGVRGSICGQH